jgi:hypothetical protein
MSDKWSNDDICKFLEVYEKYEMLMELWNRWVSQQKFEKWRNEKLLE